MDNSQKFIARNRAPRVQIEYDVELYGASRKVRLPFVMGVMADLLGQPREAAAPLADRQFLPIDVDTFDARMKAMRPRLAFHVPNALTGDGQLPVELTFEQMDDFSPAAIASQVPALRHMLEARQRLSDLLTYMDGKVNAESLIQRLLAEQPLLESLAQATQPPEPAPPATSG